MLPTLLPRWEKGRYFSISLLVATNQTGKAGLANWKVCSKPTAFLSRAEQSEVGTRQGSASQESGVRGTVNTTAPEVRPEFKLSPSGVSLVWE